MIMNITASDISSIFSLLDEEMQNGIYVQAVQFFDQYALTILVTSVLVGTVFAFIFQYYAVTVPERNAAKRREEILEEEISERNETSRIRTNEEQNAMLFEGRGRIDTNALMKKYRVAFNPQVEERTGGGSDSDENLDDLDVYEEDISISDFERERECAEQEEEEQMPQFNKRKVKSGTTRKVSIPSEDNPIDSDRITSTLGKLHEKLASARLQAETRQKAAEMSQMEKEHEAKMKAEQMKSIMSLMMNNKEKFGLTNEEEVKQQLNLYNV